VNKTELAEAVAGKTGLDKRQAEAAVSAMTETIIAEVKAGNRVSLFGFGTFDPRARAARIGRNPQTQTPVKIAASKTVGFKAAAAFKTALNTKGGAKKAAAKKAPAAKTPAKKAAPAKATKAAKKR
jgi:DNA-binding protein HU-beta